MSVLGGTLLQKLYLDYEQSTKMKPFGFQKRAVETIAKVCAADGKSFFGEFPTGGGKSVMIALLAHVLQAAFQKTVYIVAPNPVLTTIGLTKFALKDYGVDELESAADKKIHMIRHTTLDEFEVLPDAALESSVFIVDEADYCFGARRMCIRKG